MPRSFTSFRMTKGEGGGMTFRLFVYVNIINNAIDKINYIYYTLSEGNFNWREKL